MMDRIEPANDTFCQLWYDNVKEPVVVRVSGERGKLWKIGMKKEVPYVTFSYFYSGGRVQFNLEEKLGEL